MSRWMALLTVVLIAAFVGASWAQEERELRPRRLYFGAPPATPHPTAPPMQNCLGCHGQAGGFAPQTPHPTQIRCTQCHVNGAVQAAPYHANGFAGLRPPTLDRPTTTSPAATSPPATSPAATSPPRMLHSALLREDCLACHAPGARDSVVATPHPERRQCQLCHLPQRATAASGNLVVE